MKNFHKAFLKAQTEMPALLKDKTNPAFKAAYATLAQVQDTAFPVLNRNGLLVTQTVRTEATEHALLVVVEASVVHAESGEALTTTLAIPPVKVDPQGCGSAITYARRFALMTLLGLAPDDDDDGNAASGQMRNVTQQFKPQPKPQPKPTTPEPPVWADWRNGADAIEYAVLQGVDKERAAAEYQALKDVLKPKSHKDMFAAWLERVPALVEVDFSGAEQPALVSGDDPRLPQYK